MTHTYIKFESQTLGRKAVSVLNSKGIKSKLKRNPNPNHKEGCNFALYVYSDIWQAYDIIMQHHIKNLGVESFRDRL